MTESILFTALADSTRRDLLLNLAQNSPKTATQLSDEYPITRQAILKHLNVLQEAGLVTVQQQGRDKRYYLTLDPLDNLQQWIEELNALWDRRLLRLKALVEDEQGDE